MNANRRGFTIVELLIVIVVIAILAAITVVAYNGIQTKAENDKTINAVGVYIKAIQLYAVENDQYPSTSTWPCLGDYGSLTGTVCGAVVDAPSSTCNYSGGTSVNAAFDTLLSGYIAKKPSMSVQRMDCDGDVYVGAFYNKNDTDPKNATILVFFKGDVPCPAIAGIQLGVRAQTGTTTRCRVTMPTLP